MTAAKTLEPGHYQTIIDRMEAYLEEERWQVVALVQEKKFDEAYELSIEIRETSFWIKGFEDAMSDEISLATTGERKTSGLSLT